jgi:hypothetical protein
VSDHRRNYTPPASDRRDLRIIALLLCFAAVVLWLQVDSILLGGM